MKTDRQILIDARALILDPKDWTQNEYYRGECRCSIGAGADAAGITVASFEMSDVGHLLETQACVMLGLDPKTNAGDCFYVVKVNDGEREVAGLTPHQAVIAMFDAAIAAA